jgi:hypothetical protein
MGYFSELDLTKKEEYEDRSYHGFEEQLLWRYEDLRDRYLELLEADAPCVGDDYYSKDDYRYAPVEYFATISDVGRALEVAKEDLENKCGIVVRDDGSIEEKEDEEQDPDQITVFEIVLLPTWFKRRLRHKSSP